jgi:hypothetical protein
MLLEREKVAYFEENMKYINTSYGPNKNVFIVEADTHSKF